MRRKINSWILCLVILGAIGAGAIISYLVNRGNPTTIETLLTITSTCQQSTGLMAAQCFRANVSPLVEKKGANEVIMQLDALFATQRSQGSAMHVSCHDIAHIVGELAGKTGEIGEVLGSCTNACGYGCQHGVLLGAVQKNPATLQQLATVCQKGEHPQDYDACVHGLGHAISDIAQSKFSGAFALCDQLIAVADKKTCAEGVFMEIVDAPSLGRAPYMINQSIHDFCEQFMGVYKDVCFETGGLHVFTSTRDPLRAKQACITLPQQHVEKCLTSLVNTLYYVWQADVPQIAKFCRETGVVLELPCVIGAIQSDVVTNKNPQYSIALCGLVAVENQLSCFKALGDKVEYVYGKNIRTSVCQEISTDVREACVQ
jgi:hypothetical protein